VAGQPVYAAEKKRLRAILDRWMRETKDPRVRDQGDPWDHYPYVGG